MLNFDELLVEVLCVHPDVRAVYREDTENKMGTYVLDVEDGAEASVVEAVTTRVHEDLMYVFGTRSDKEAKLLWRRTAVRKAQPKATKPTTPPPLNELVESLRETLLKERNALILEGEVAEFLVGYIFDVSDPCCPAKFKEMVGGDRFIEHCKAGNRLPLAVGVMPKHIVSKYVEPIARKVEKMPASPIIYANAPVPRTIQLLENWRQPNEMVVVTGYQKMLGLKAIAVPTMVKIET